jgi:hypothetical protein
MSKIALTPSATGTGVFTISSPATNTDRTLTLPDEAGSIVVNTATGIDVTGTVTADGLTVDDGEILLDSSTQAFLKLDRGSTSHFALTRYYNSGTEEWRTGTFNGGDTNYNIGTSANKYVSITTGGDISFYEDTGTTAKFFWDASAESLGIGTSSPSFEGGTGTGLEINNSSGNGAHVKLTDAASGSGGTNGFDLYAFNTNGYIENYEAGSIVFRNGGAEAARIDSTGKLLLGVTGSANTSRMSVLAYQNSICIETRTSANGYYPMWFYNAANVMVGYITSNSNSTSYNTTSDYRLKTDAQPMTGASARVQALKPVNFEWISDGTRVDGFLAHEAQEVVPEAVHGTKDAMRDEEYEVTAAVYEDIIIAAVLDEEGNEIEAERTEQRLVSEAVMGTRSVPDMQGIDQSKLVPLLTAALQEALTEISALKVRVAALEAV